MFSLFRKLQRVGQTLRIMSKGSRLNQRKEESRNLNRLANKNPILSKNPSQYPILFRHLEHHLFGKTKHCQDKTPRNMNQPTVLFLIYLTSNLLNDEFVSSGNRILETNI
jgi:hypothetical protein